MMKVLVALTLVVLFNDFIGSMVALIGALLVRVGTSLQVIPDMF
mgnify:CR=1 FL=1